jgi:glycosyltransferase involved in cell wall biosynthesis
MNGGEIGGAGNCLLRLCTELVKKTDYKISIINTEDGILNDELKKIGITIYVIQSVYLKKIFLPKEIFRVFSNSYKFKKIVAFEKPNIIHAFTLPLVRRVFLFKRIGIKIPIIGTIHDELTEEHFGKKKVGFFVKYINKYYKCLISVSKSTKNIATKNGVNENIIRVIYNGIPKISVNIKPLIKDYFAVGSFGRITKSKGQDVLIEAIHLLQNKIPSIKCYIVGKPPLGVDGSLEYFNSLKEKVKQYKLENNIVFVEWTSNINYFYNQIDVYVLNSINYDPFPTVNLEAMMHKKPVIAVNIGGSVEQIDEGKNGYLVEPNNPEIAAEKILYLYQNRQKLIEMGENGYKKVTEEFSIEKYTSSHIDLYHSILLNEN